MKSPRPRKRLGPGYVSYVLVLSAGVMLTLMTLSAYRSASSAQLVQTETQIRVDYADKEDAVLRALINIVPNRAIRAMQNRSNNSIAEREPLRWKTIFSEAMSQANARESVSATVKTQMGTENGITGNLGDATFSNLNLSFDAIEPEPGYMSPGVNRSLGDGFPVPLEVANSTLAGYDAIYPIISDDKVYGNLASDGVTLPVAEYSKVNIIPYPEIRFGYCAPGQPFVAKRNWWAFSLQLGENDQVLKSFSRGDGSVGERDFIISIYEIPSQLAISAEAFTEIGAHADGTAWQNTTIEGGIYSTRAQVGSGMHLDRIAGRRGLELDDGVTIGDDAIGGDPFAPGVREQFEVTNGTFMPVTLASEAGRAAFVPINRGADYFDRFAHTAESNVLSTTTWNNYSVGALQCAMRLDITAVSSSTDTTPTALRFQYFAGGVRQTMVFPLDASGAVPLPSDFVKVADQDQSYDFGTQIVDAAYGVSDKFYFRTGVTGNITFDNSTFGDPLVGSEKGGWFRPSPPFEVKFLHGVKPSIAIYPERFPAFLQAIGADSVAVNSSMVVNVDYSVTGINDPDFKPKIPCTDTDYAVLLTECGDLTAFTKGFSLVTNLRLYVGDDYNNVTIAAPTGTTLAPPYYPPASLFAPELRWGTDVDPPKIDIIGQMGHLRGDDGTTNNPVGLLDLKMASEVNAGASSVTANLRPITCPDELPPITMMNWLIVIEERRKMFYSGAGAN